MPGDAGGERDGAAGAATEAARTATGRGPGELLVRHPLAWGWLHAAVVSALLVVGVLVDWNLLVMAALVALLVVPSLAATVFVLEATPRKRFEQMSSVFGHFFVRYLALVFGVGAWGASVVIGAAISQTIQLAAEGRETEIVGIGFGLLATILPSVVAVLWGAFVVRCAWFLVKVRGWREAPEHDRIPDRMLARHPRRRRVVVGLAHPGLFFATGLVSVFALLAAEATTAVLLFE